MSVEQATPRKFTVITHYDVKDTTFSGDHRGQEILDEDKNVIAEFGDAYHDDAQAKVEGFMLAVEWLTGVEPEVEDKLVADWDR